MTSSTRRPVPVPRRGDEVRTRRGHRYRLAREIGRGGQGAVFAAEQGGAAIKVRYFDDAGGSWARGIERLRRLPGEVPDLKGFVLPNVRLAEPHVGYQMKLLEGGVPLSELIRLDRDAPEESYVASGGLKRRLRVAWRVARRVAELHSLGLLFGDLSANNVLVADAPDKASLQLIDCDNIRAPGTPGDVVGTPGYIAPELVRGLPAPTSASDDYALAVLLHELVYLTHPLRGDALLELDADEGEAQVREGRVPWVFAADDQSNRATGGLPPQLAVARGHLWKLLKTAFTAGIHTPGRRPSAAKLAAAAELAARMAETCPACRASFLVRAHDPDCPWCGGVLPDLWVVRFRPDADWGPTAEALEVRRRVERLNEQKIHKEQLNRLRPHPVANLLVDPRVTLTTRLLTPWRVGEHGDQRELVIYRDGRDIVATAGEGAVLTVGGKPLQPGKDRVWRQDEEIVVQPLEGEASVAPGCRLELRRLRRGASRL